MKIDQASAIEPANNAIVVEDLTVPDEQPERVRIKLDELDVVIGVAARATDSSHLVASCDLPFLRLGSRLNLEWAEREKEVRRGTLDWVALEVADEERMPRIKLGLGLDQVSAMAQGERPKEPRGRGGMRMPALALPRGGSTPRRWLGRLALVGLGVLAAGVGSAIVGGRDETPRPSAVSEVLPVPLPPQVIVTPPPERPSIVDRANSTTEATSAAPSVAQTTAASESSRKTPKARRAARRASLKRSKVTRYLRWARRAMKRRRAKRARHLARLVLLLDPGNRSATQILRRR